MTVKRMDRVAIIDRNESEVPFARGTVKRVEGRKRIAWVLVDGNGERITAHRFDALRVVGRHHP